MATAATATPMTTSSDYDAMRPYWNLVDNILGGAETMRAAGPDAGWRAAVTTTSRTGARASVGENPYLPKFPNEDPADYRYRVANAPFTNIFADVLSGLAAKPFAEEVQLADGAPDKIKALCEDIDGRGNNLHRFAGD